MSVPKNVIEDVIKMFKELYPLYELQREAISPIQTEILNYLSIYPDETAYSLTRDQTWLIQLPTIRIGILTTEL